MERGFLENLGLEKDIIDQIMTENGKDISREKQKADSLKTQLDTAKETLKGFEGVNVTELQGKVTQLTADLTAKETEYQGKLAEMEFQSVLDAAVADAKPLSTKLLKAALADSMDALRASKHQAEDIRNAIAKAKEENSFLFESDEPVQNPVAPTGGNPPKGKKMTLLEAMRYKNDHPEADVKSLLSDSK